MNFSQDPCGASQSYLASIMAVLVSVTQSDAWTAIIAIVAAAVLCIRLYKEVKGLFEDKE